MSASALSLHPACLMYDAPTEVCGDSLAGPEDLGESDTTGSEVSQFSDVNLVDFPARSGARPFPFMESNDGTRLRGTGMSALALSLHPACTHPASTHEPAALEVHPVQSATPYRVALHCASSLPRSMDRQTAVAPSRRPGAA